MRLWIGRLQVEPHCHQAADLADVPHRVDPALATLGEQGGVGVGGGGGRRRWGGLVEDVLGRVVGLGPHEVN
jgi:hypothetical protein